MAALYANGGIVVVILAAMAIEALVLVLLFRRTGRGVPPGVLLPNLAAGACLIAAAGSALRGAWWGWTGALLLAGGALHALDLRNRWQSRRTEPGGSRSSRMQRETAHEPHARRRR